MNEAVYEENNDYAYSLGNGISFNFDDSNHVFRIGGMAQFRYLNSRAEDSLISPSNYIGIKRSYFLLSGHLNNKMFSFLVQTDFSESSPLLDAWVGYHPNTFLNFYFGQKMTSCNNLSMQFMEYDLQFASRNHLSSTFSRLGREFGVFVESHFMLGNIGFAPMLALTSGDGINSFGENSLDNDQGGFKYGGRLNIYPLGYFSNGNNFTGHDLKNEQKPKLMIGGASSLNIGASHRVGEGHYNQDLLDEETFIFYNADSILQTKLPNYLKNNIDILFKYKGFNLLVEYVNTAAYNLQSTAINTSGDLLDTTQISQYLTLGNAFNIQMGYVFKGDLSLDFKYGQSFKEFKYNENSVLKNYDNLGLGITKYFSNRAVKVQFMARYLNFYENTELNQMNLECMLQVRF
jgi:hypothetical protein